MMMMMKVSLFYLVGDPNTVCSSLICLPNKKKEGKKEKLSFIKFHT